MNVELKLEFRIFVWEVIDGFFLFLLLFYIEYSFFFVFNWGLNRVLWIGKYFD